MRLRDFGAVVFCEGYFDASQERRKFSAASKGSTLQPTVSQHGLA